MAVRMNQEAGGFKLLEEDALDDRPCAAVKKFVSSVLDRKDMKDQEVASSFRNLMEYRDSTSSPSACSVATSTSALEGDRLNSPPSPSSPSTAPGPMDDQRLPNELLDEICEDIGMKEGMELDFVEYLMEQDSNPQIYMTQEAISSGAFNSAANSTISTPTGSASGGSNSGSASGSHASNNNNDSNKTLTLLNPPSTTTPNFLFKPNFNDSDWLSQFPSPLVHSSSGHSSGATTIQSSENNSPSNKRIHLSISTDTSPNKGRSQTPPGFNQQMYGGHMSNHHNMFKMPPPAPLTKRSHSFPQGAPASSPVQSTHSSSSQGSNASSNGHAAFSRPQEFSMNPPSSCPPSDSSDQEENMSNNKKVPCVSPKPVLPASSSSCDFNKPGSPACVQGQYNAMSGSMGGRDGSVFQRVGKQQPPPNVNVKAMQQQQQHQQQMQHQQQSHQRWLAPASKQGPHNMNYFNKNMYPSGPFPAHHTHPHHHPNMGHIHMAHMTGPPGPHNPPVRTPVDSPLDQGYFSNESGNCSNGSAPSPAFTTSSISSFSSISTMMPADQSQGYQKSSIMQQPPQQSSSGMANSRPSGQKSVHFADMPEGSPPAYTSQNSNSVGMDVKPFRPGTQGDCAFELESNGQPKGMQSMKILPRINHNMKSGVAPYTVPNSQMVGPPGPPGYDFTNRSSCAMGGPGEPASPDTMQDYMSKSSPLNGSNNSFYVDGNQNMMRIDSMQEYPPSSGPPAPPPLMPQPQGEYGVMRASQPRYGMDQFSSMQQQQQPAPHHQSSHPPHGPPSSSESMQAAPPPHPQMQSMQQQHQSQGHQFPSCSHSGPGMGQDYVPPHLNNMQITNSSGPGNYQMPLAMSTPVTNRSGLNGRINNSYGPQMGPPSYENTYGQGGHPEMYPSQNAQGPPQHPNQGMMPIQQTSVHRGWPSGHPGPPGMHGGEELQVHIGGMHPVPGPMKAGLQPPHPQGLPHMQPSPTPGCAAPMGPGQHMQELNMINSSAHMNSGMGPPHAHVGPHPDYGPCMGMNCNTCKMAQTGSPPHPHPHMGPCAGPNCPTCKMNQTGPPPPAHVGPCGGTGCSACKMQHVNRPQMLSSQQKFIQHLIMDEGNSAYRSHPLFPLLRDLVIAEMNFDNPQFHCQQLLSHLPNDFHKLLQNFLHRNPPSGHYQSNQAVESVIMDSLRLAHSNLVDKIRHRQEIEKMKANSSASLRSMEEFCQKFDHSVNGPMARPVPNGVNSMNMGHHMGGYHEGGYMQPGMSHMGQYRSLKDGPDMLGDVSLAVASPQANKTESKKHPSLPKEAVAMMMEWLRSHKDNPYPNDDEKAMLIKQTGLSINQINYWFTNARRRILPKWAQCKT